MHINMICSINAPVHLQIIPCIDRHVIICLQQFHPKKVNVIFVMQITRLMFSITRMVDKFLWVQSCWGGYAEHYSRMQLHVYKNLQNGFCTR